MTTDDVFVAYVGLADFHDGSVLRVVSKDRAVLVTIRGTSGREYTMEFSDVENIKMDHPENMTLYAVSEMQNNPPYRRFVFSNGDEADSASLEIVAKDFAIKHE